MLKKSSQTFKNTPKLYTFSDRKGLSLIRPLRNNLTPAWNIPKDPLPTSGTISSFLKHPIWSRKNLCDPSPKSKCSKHYSLHLLRRPASQPSFDQRLTTGTFSSSIIPHSRFL